MGVEAVTGNVSVGGRLKPGNEVRKTLIVRSAILFEVMLRYHRAKSFTLAFRGTRKQKSLAVGSFT